MRRFTAIGGTIIALGCSGRAIDVGAPGTSSGRAGFGNTAVATSAGGATGVNPATPAGDCSNGDPLPHWPDDTACLAASDLPLVGTWYGYVETKGPPWDQMTLVIKGASVAGGVCGTLTIGPGPPPAPPTDATTGYPPGTTIGTGGAGNGPSLLFESAYPLMLSKGVTDGTRVQFSVLKGEPYRGWCQLQSAFAVRGAPAAPCTCLPSWSAVDLRIDRTTARGMCTVSNFDNSLTMTADCGKAELCLGYDAVCVCNDTGCDASSDAGTVDFDLRFNDLGGVGSNTETSAFRTDFLRNAGMFTIDGGS